MSPSPALPLPEALSEGLNGEQRALLEHDLSAAPLLVLAGAGTGKTTSLVRRLAREVLEQSGGERLLALTFTRKAAAEMRERAHAQLRRLGSRHEPPWCGTFHALGQRILNEPVGGLDGWTRLGRVRPRLLDEAQADASRARFWQERFRRGAERPWTSLELERLRVAWTFPASLEAAQPDHPGLPVWKDWEAWKLAQGILDFEDLIGLSIRLLEEDPAVAAHWNARASTLLVDEYQDTNRSQFRLVKALLGPSRRLLAVGDDDQSIYGFRGADIGNILEFREDFPDARLLKLEANYRSTGRILSLANRVFPDKPPAYRKRLGNGRALEGAEASWWRALDEDEELAWLRAEVRAFLSEGIPPREIAVLTRSNRQAHLVLAALAEACDAPANTPEGLQVLTVHAAKGLEWNAVLLPFQDAPRAERLRLLPSGQDEERRLFYVALTRARDHLRISSCRRRRKGDAWEARSPLPWLPLVRPGVVPRPGRLRRLGRLLSTGSPRMRFPC